MARAKREALEMAGVYVEGLTIVKDSRVDKDDVLALTAGALKAEVVSQKNYHTDEPLAKVSKTVTPVKTGVQNILNSLDSGFRRNDKEGPLWYFCKRLR